MKIPYTKFRSLSPHFDFFYRPMLNICIVNGARSRMQKGLVDSGADHTLINASIAKDLRIDYENTTEIDQTTGIENRPIITYYHKIEIVIPGIDNSNFETKIGFVNSNSVGILIGQKGFFDKFIVNFNKKNNFFTVDLNI